MAGITAQRTGIAGAAAGVIAIAVAFTPTWEGRDSVARVDTIGTGKPITYCYGQTDRTGQIKVGTKFTKQQCDVLLAETLPHYLALIEPCITVELPDKTKAALLDAAYNAGPSAVCRSPMLKRMNAGDIRGGCNAFAGWRIESDKVVRKGLIARRGGIGDGRKSEKDLCLEGLAEPSAKRDASVSPPPAAPPPKRSWWRWS